MCNHQPFISSMIPKDHKTWFSEPGRLDLFQDLNNPPHKIAFDISNGAAGPGYVMNFPLDTKTSRIFSSQ